MDKSVVDFGKVRPGQELTTSIVVANNGNTPLLVERIKTSCGCTKASISSSSIPPQSFADLQLVFAVPNVRGPMKKYVSLYSNDSASPEYVLEINASVTPTAALEPNPMNFGSVPRTSLPVSKNASLLMDADSHLAPADLLVECGSPHVAVQLSGGAPGQDMSLSATLMREVPSGYHTMHCTIKRRDDLSVIGRGIILAHVKGEAYSTPDSLVFSISKETPLQVRDVAFYSHKQPVRVISSSVSPALWTLTEVQSGASASSCEVRVSLPPQWGVSDNIDKLEGHLLVSLEVQATPDQDASQAALGHPVVTGGPNVVPSKVLTEEYVVPIQIFIRDVKGQ